MKYLNRIILCLLITVSLIAFLLIDNYQGQIQYTKIGDEQFVAADYDSKVQSDNGDTSRQQHKFSDIYSSKELNLKFNFVVYSLRDNDNIFQTSKENEGLRLETTNEGKLYLVYGISSKGAEQTYNSKLLLDKIEFGKQYSLELDISNRNRAKVIIDNKSVLDSFINSLDYKVDDIAVGTGYNKSRPFSGKITSFVMNCTSYSTNSGIISFLKIIKIVLYVAILFLLSLVLFNEEIKFKKKVNKNAQR
jgi:hypothetical protein